MRVEQAKELFRELTQSYFAGANVVFANQSRTPMQELPLVLLTPGPVHRQPSPSYEDIGGERIGNYLSRLSITVDLFTDGSPVKEGETDEVLAYADSSVEDLLAFEDFLGSDYVIDWSHRNDVSVLIEGDVQSLTAVVNDTTYQYRARVTILFYFTQRTIERAAVLRESSIKYPVGHIDPETGVFIQDIDPETGEPVFTTEPPQETESQTGDWPKIGEPVIQPEFAANNSGGGSKELAAEETGYFTEAEVKEEKVHE